MITEKDAKVGQRVRWRSPDTNEVRYGDIIEVIDNVEVIIAYDDGAKGMCFIGNELSNVSPA
jgi:hypothetical protein